MLKFLTKSFNDIFGKDICRWNSPRSHPYKFQNFHFLILSSYEHVISKTLSSLLIFPILFPFHILPMSSPQTPLDLNLSISGQVAGNTISWQPSPESTPVPIISNDSVIVNPATALRSADQILTPRDQELLARRSDYAAADESTWLNIQAAASVTNLCHRLRARARENESLRIQLALLRKLQQELNTKVDRLRKEKKEYKKENKVLKEENKKASLIISRYQTEMKTKLDALQASGERLEVKQKMLIFDIPSVSNMQP